MNFKFNENQKMISDMIKVFGKKYISPFSRKWDDEQHFPINIFKKLGELGLMGVLKKTSLNQLMLWVEKLNV